MERAAPDGLALPTSTMDFVKHNADQRAVWEAYSAGRPLRPPMIIGCNERISMDMPLANPTGITFRQMFEDPAAMLRRQLEHQYYVRTTIPQDAEMGLPEKGWRVGIVRYNVFEAACFGCEIVFEDGLVPDTVARFESDQSKGELLKNGVPDPLDCPFMAKVWSDREWVLDQQRDGYSFLGRPLSYVGACAGYTDGPVTVACNLRGAANFLEDLYADPEYADDLMDLIVEAAIVRIRAVRKQLGEPERSAGIGFADDSVQLMSTEMYVERVLPRHRRLIEELGDGSPNSIHLCGDATRHFPAIARELNVRSFDTGFPVDFGALRAALGPDVEIIGGPSVPFLQTSTAEQVRAETRRILDSGVCEGGRFILREGNNLPADVPIANLQAMYDEVRRL